MSRRIFIFKMEKLRLRRARSALCGVNRFLMVVSPLEACVSNGKDTTWKLNGPRFEFYLFKLYYIDNLLNSWSLTFINYKMEMLAIYCCNRN